MAGQELSIPQVLSRRVLILDFDAVTVMKLEQLLEEAGFNTTTTWSMREACLLLEQQRFDLIVVGDHRPQVDACGILHCLENLHSLIPCIVIRAQPDFSTTPKWSRLTTAVSGCSGPEVLEKVIERLGGSTSTHSSSEWATVTDDSAEPVVLKMMWGDNHTE